MSMSKLSSFKLDIQKSIYKTKTYDLQNYLHFMIFLSPIFYKSISKNSKYDISHFLRFQKANFYKSQYGTYFKRSICRISYIKYLLMHSNTYLSCQLFLQITSTANNGLEKINVYSRQDTKPTRQTKLHKRNNQQQCLTADKHPPSPNS